MRPLEIPFKQVFAHFSATRAQTESVLVIAESANGHRGIGEGCPRHYVTGETYGTCQKFFAEYQAGWKQFSCIEDVKAWIKDYEKLIDRNPAIWCAVELALLDLLGKESEKSIEQVLSVPELSGEFQYSAVLGTESLTSYQKQLQQFVALGFNDFKIKVSGSLEEDIQKIDLLKNAGVSNVRMRLDANNLWKTAEDAIHYLRQLDCPLLGIEEPVQVSDYSSCRRIYDSSGIPIILDESLLRLDQFGFLESSPKTWIINIRISKMGGIVRSLAVAEKAKALGIPIIIGAQVGESSILTRAALTVANSYREILLAQEGAFGTYLLEHDITDGPIMFGKKGLLQAQAFSPHIGHGVVISI